MTSKQPSPIAPPGEMVDIGGFRLHAWVRGTGRPAVVFEPGLGGFAQQYIHIQSAVAGFTQAVAYDRAGQGWSEVSPNPRTPEHLAGELWAVLANLKIQPPFVLVGHSFGGLLVRIFANSYPEATAGIILVDSSDVDQYDFIPDLDKMIKQTAKGVALLKFAARLGLAKPLTRLSMGRAVKSLSSQDLELFLDNASRPKHHETMLAEFTQHRCYFGAQSQVPGDLRDLPVTIVTAGNSVSGQGKMAGMPLAEVNARHQRMQNALLQISTQSEQIVIPDASHLSILTHPEQSAQVVDAIWRMVEKIRRN